MNQWNEGKRKKKRKKCQNVTRQNSIGVFFSMLAKKFEMTIFHIVKYDVDNIIFKYLKVS